MESDSASPISVCHMAALLDWIRSAAYHSSGGVNNCVSLAGSISMIRLHLFLLLAAITCAAWILPNSLVSVHVHAIRAHSASSSRPHSQSLLSPGAGLWDAAGEDEQDGEAEAETHGVADAEAEAEAGVEATADSEVDGEGEAELEASASVVSGDDALSAAAARKALPAGAATYERVTALRDIKQPTVSRCADDGGYAFLTKDERGYVDPDNTRNWPAPDKALLGSDKSTMAVCSSGLMGHFSVTHNYKYTRNPITYHATRCITSTRGSVIHALCGVICGTIYCCMGHEPIVLCFWHGYRMLWYIMCVIV